MGKATVGAIRTARYDGQQVVTCWVYKAIHECDRLNHWQSRIDEWPSTFRAAHRHVRSCGQGERVISSGAYTWRIRRGETPPVVTISGTSAGREA
jgi:hypothetical protein